MQGSPLKKSTQCVGSPQDFGTARAARRVPKSKRKLSSFCSRFFLLGCYKQRMKVKNKPTKARVTPEGLMGSASREHRVKKGKGSFRRNSKHKRNCE
jgi:hypothetical protein